MNGTTSRVVRVLIVDDDYQFNSDLSYYLQRCGYEILNAFTVEDFKRLAPEADVVFLDIRLPDRDGALINTWGGLQALREILAREDISESTRNCLAKVIIRSGHTKEEASRAGEKIPPHHRWLATDAPLYEIMRALQELIPPLQRFGSDSD